MWISVIGAESTAKSMVVEILGRDGFDLIRDQEPLPSPEGSGCAHELQWAETRLKTQQRASVLSSDHDVVTVRTVWDSFHCFIPLALDRNEITREERGLLFAWYETLKNSLRPPTAVIWMKAQKMTIYDRALLKGGSVDDQRIALLMSYYEKYASSIAVPVVEINASETPERIAEQLEFGVASLRTNRVSEHSIWRREMFR